MKISDYIIHLFGGWTLEDLNFLDRHCLKCEDKESPIEFKYYVSCTEEKKCPFHLPIGGKQTNSSTNKTIKRKSSVVRKKV